jgi:hypothetical protein
MCQQRHPTGRVNGTRTPMHCRGFVLMHMLAGCAGHVACCHGECRSSAAVVATAAVAAATASHDVDCNIC